MKIAIVNPPTSCPRSCFPSDMTIMGCKCDENLSPYCQMFLNIYPWDKPVETYLKDCKHYSTRRISLKLENL